MIERFAVRTTETGCGVWDAGTSGWRSKTDLDLAAAEATAELLNMQEHAPTVATARSSSPVASTPCQVYLYGRWCDGYLTEWRQGADRSWWGIGRCENQEWTDWVPAKWLRPR
jgi:hypothetical protein